MVLMQPQVSGLVREAGSIPGHEQGTQGALVWHRDTGHAAPLPPRVDVAPHVPGAVWGWCSVPHPWSHGGVVLVKQSTASPVSWC